jgi:hypothetical protein
LFYFYIYNILLYFVLVVFTCQLGLNREERRFSTSFFTYYNLSCRFMFESVSSLLSIYPIIQTNYFKFLNFNRNCYETSQNVMKKKYKIISYNYLRFNIFNSSNVFFFFNLLYRKLHPLLFLKMITENTYWIQLVIKFSNQVASFLHLKTEWKFLICFLWKITVKWKKK